MVKLNFREGTDLPPGEYDAVVGKIVIKTSREGSDFLAWPFWIGGDGQGQWVDAASSLSTSTKSKAAGWIKAIVGSLPPGEDIDLDVLEGMDCRIIVEINPEGWPKVAAVLSARAAAVPAQRPAPAAAAPRPAPQARPAPPARPAPQARPAPTLEPF